LLLGEVKKKKAETLVESKFETDYGNRYLQVPQKNLHKRPCLN